MEIKRVLTLTLTIMLLLSCMSITAFAESTTYDYTIVLSGGKAYKDSTGGDDITSAVANMGLTYTDDVWTMNNFSFSTTAESALLIKGEDKEDKIILKNTNTISVERPASKEIVYAYGIAFYSKCLTIGGDGTLNISSTTVSDENAAYGISSMNGDTYGLVVQDSVVITINATNKYNDYFATGISAEVTVENNAEIKITATCPGSAYTVTSGSEHDATATDTSTGKLLTCNRDEYSCKYTYYNGESIATSATLTAVNSALNSASSLTEQGGASFTVDGNAAATANKGDTVTATATPVAGYTATLSASDNVTDFDAAAGTFTMPGSAVTVTATYTQNPVDSKGEINLDLEDSTADIPVSTTIDQYYTKAAASSTVYKNKILVEWSNDTMNIKVADAKKWNPSTLEWETDEAKNGVATVDGETNKVTCTLTNYSAKAFTCNLTFAEEESQKAKFASYAVDNENVTLAAVENNINQPGTSIANGVIPTAKITATITPTLTGAGSFADADATASPVKYGTFTITCTAAATN